MDQEPRVPLEQHPILFPRLAYRSPSLLFATLQVKSIQSEVVGIARHLQSRFTSRQCRRLSRLFPTRRAPSILWTLPFLAQFPLCASEPP